MDFSHPLQTVSAALGGDLLQVLARADRAWSGRELAREVGASPVGALKALDRLVGHGIVVRDVAHRNAHQYSLNREHLAAPAVMALANLSQALVSRLKEEIARWAVQPAAATLFGSTARGQAERRSDIDILVVRGHATDADDPTWMQQLLDLEQRASTWTGNDTRILEMSIDEAASDEIVVRDAIRDGIPLSGNLRRLARASR